MKKFIAILLAALMLLSVVSCGNKQDVENPDDEKNPGNVEDPDNKGEEPSGNDSVTVDPNVEAGTMGEALWNAFVNEMTANKQITMDELANKLVQNTVIQFMGGAMPLEAGQEYFAGFDNYKIEGYESGALYAPMIGSIPFAGYVFRLADGVSTQEFVDNLKSHCNPSWNICVTADQTVAGAVDNVVFFLMCPKDLGDEKPSGNDPVIIDPNVEAGTMGEALWNDFVMEVQSNPTTSMLDLAGYLVTSPVIQFMGGATPLEANQEYFAGFDNYKIEGYESGAIYMPMIGSIPFVGYVFELSDGVNTQEFLDNLTSNCNPRWNVCVAADQTVAGAVGNVVFFLMCPASIEG